MTYKEVQVVVSDLDGTLLGSDNKIGAYTRRTLKKLDERGIDFIVATGRHYLDAKYIRNSIGIPAYLISANGARIHDHCDNLIYQADVDEDVVKSILTMLKDDDSITLNLFTDSGWLASKEYTDIEKFHPDSDFIYQLFDKAIIETIAVKNVAKLSVSRPSGKHLEDLEKKLVRHFAGRANIYLSTPTNLEVTAIGVSKGSALQLIAKRQQRKLEHFMSFGDAMNDLEMLTLTGHALIMSDADEYLVKKLTHNKIIGHSADQAVAKYIEKHLL